MQLLRVFYLVFFAGYSLGLCLGTTFHAYLARRVSYYDLPADFV